MLTCGDGKERQRVEQRDERSDFGLVGRCEMLSAARLNNAGRIFK
jgi:hypothetical protein